MRVSLCLCLGAAVAACNLGGPSLEERNAVRPVPDPTADATSPSAPFLPGQRRSVADANAAFAIEAYNQWVTGVTLPGDLDRDGFDDLVLWGQLANPPDTVPCDRGCPAFGQVAAHIVYGGADFGRSPRLVPGATLVSWHINSVRAHVAAAGDVDGDGARDLLVSVGTDGCEQGSVFVVRGGARLRGVIDVRDAGALLRETGGCQRFGDAAGVGDLDRDGRGDFAVASPTTRRVHLYYGTPGAPPTRRSEADADARFVSASGSALGAAVAAGDVDGDGRGDLLLGLGAAPGDHDFWLVRGGEARFAGEVEVERVGTRITAATLAPLGDLDGDGRHELGATVRAGERDGFVLAGRRDWPARLDARDASTWIPRAPDAPQDPAAVLLSAGDVDGDGARDVLYGDPSYTVNGTRLGAVLLLRGPLGPGALSRSAGTSFLGQEWVSQRSPAVRRGLDNLGVALGAADFNADGLSDLVFGAPGAPDGGRVYVWMGRRAR